jgi:hypothetical protein
MPQEAQTAQERNGFCDFCASLWLFLGEHHYEVQTSVCDYIHPFVLTAQAQQHGVMGAQGSGPGGPSGASDSLGGARRFHRLLVSIAPRTGVGG